MTRYRVTALVDATYGAPSRNSLHTYTDYSSAC